jgi:PAS domain S-box-containing protein
LERPRIGTLALFAALTLLGILGNLARYPVFFSIDFVFGSIFAFLALQFLGTRAGLLSLFAGSCTTWFLWNHPYAIVIMTAEGAVVAWLARRRKVPYVLADILYWLFVGMPLVYLFYRTVMRLPANTVLVTMFKQAVNGVMNVLAARFAFMLLTYRLRKERFALREIFLSSLILFTLLPALFFIAVQSRQEQQETDRTVRRTLALTRERVTAGLVDWLEGHAAHVNYVARVAATEPASEVQEALERMVSSDPVFLRGGLVDESATVTAYFPLRDELGVRNIGRNFADRPYIPVLKATLKPMLSEVVMGRIGKPAPIAPLLAPVVRNGAYAGYVAGILDISTLDRICDMDTRSTSLPGMRYMILDRNGRVVVSNRPGVKTMDTFRREAGEVVSLGDGLSQWVPPLKKNISVSDKWKRAVYISEGGIGSLSEWHLVLEAPVEPFQQRMYGRYTGTLVMLWTGLVLASVGGFVLSRFVLTSLERLKTLSSEMPDKLAEGGPLPGEESIIEETGSLQDNFRNMLDALRGKFAEIRRINVSLEERIEERTRELSRLNVELEGSMREAHEAKGLLQSILDAAPLAIGWYDRQSRLRYLNPKFRQGIGYSPEEIGTADAWFRCAYPDPAYRAEVTARWAAMRQEALDSGGTAFGPLEVTIACADGAKRCFDVWGGVLPDVELAIFSDITDRKGYERQLADYAEAQRVLLREVNHRVKNNLAAILGMLRLEEGRAGDAPVEPLLRELVGRVMALSSVHSMLSSSEWRSISLHDLCTQIIESSIVGRTGEKPAVEVSPSPVAVESSTAHNLALALNELATNSLKHASGRGGLRIGVGIATDGGDVVVTFRDNGAGFPEAVLRVGESPTGTGLRLVRGLVEMSLQGNVSLENREGACVTIRFPSGENWGGNA